MDFDRRPQHNNNKELCEGGDLRMAMQEHPAAVKHMSRPIMIQISAGVEHLHDKCILHRDIKPENILLSSRDIVHATYKIADFGQSRLLETGTMIFVSFLPIRHRETIDSSFLLHSIQGQAQITSGVGTVRYMAPELIRIHTEEPLMNRASQVFVSDVISPSQFVCIFPILCVCVCGHF